MYRHISNVMLWQKMCVLIVAVLLIASLVIVISHHRCGICCMVALLVSGFARSSFGNFPTGCDYIKAGIYCSQLMNADASWERDVSCQHFNRMMLHSSFCICHVNSSPHRKLSIEFGLMYYRRPIWRQIVTYTAVMSKPNPDLIVSSSSSFICSNR